MAEMKLALVEKRLEPVALEKLSVVRVEEPELARLLVKDTLEPVALEKEVPLREVVPVAVRAPKLPVTKLPVRILAELDTARVPTVSELIVAD